MEAVILVVGMYLFFHTPAIILLIMGLRRRKTKPKTAKILLIIAGIYFLIGTGICGSILLIN